jgi:hypothetical protein
VGHHFEVLRDHIGNRSVGPIGAAEVRALDLRQPKDDLPRVETSAFRLG